MFRYLLPLLLLCPGCSLQWRNLKSTDGGFQVLMPEETQKHSRTETTPDGSEVVLHYYLAEYSAAAFLVLWRDIDQPMLALTTPDTVLDAAVQGSWKPDSQVLRRAEPIELGEHQGRFVRIYDPGSDTITQGQIYLVGGRLYTVLATTYESWAEHEEVRGFLDSFELLPSTATPGSGAR